MDCRPTARGRCGAAIVGAEKVSFRKLSREEYANTIRDLLGVTFDVNDPTGLPEDPDWQGFQRIGSVLTLSPAHVEKYLAAADMVLNEALALGPQPKSRGDSLDAVLHTRLEGLRKGVSGPRHRGQGARRPGAQQRGLGLARPAISRPRATTSSARKLSGLRPEAGPAPRLRFYAGDISRVILEQDVEAPEDKPITIELRVHLPAGNHPIRIVNAVPGPNPEARRSRASGTPNAFTNLQSRVPWQMKFTDDDGQPIVPFLLLDYVEWEGPVVASWPTPAHQQIFFGGEQAVKNLDYARQIVGRFAERACRRPVSAAEVDRLVKLVEQSQKLGDSFEQSVKTALVAVLCSKSFLVSRRREHEFSVRALSPIGSWPRGCRISCGVRCPTSGCSTWPAQASCTKRRRSAAKCAACWPTRRPPNSPRRSRANGCNCGKVGMFAPDKALYPDYDEYLEKSMIAETTGFFREVLTRNASLREFLDSDWTLLNERLAGHYGIGGVHGEAMRRVSLTPEDHRGGLLTQGAILSLTSDGTRHRPVHRGVWVLESIVGKPPPPPPANVPALNTPAADARKTTVREKLELHRSDAELLGLPPQDRPARVWPSTITTPSAAGAPWRPCATASAPIRSSTPAESCTTAASLPMPPA